MLGRLQMWLQMRSWPLWRIGNGISSLRFCAWKLRGSPEPEVDASVWAAVHAELGLAHADLSEASKRSFEELDAVSD